MNEVSWQQTIDSEKQGEMGSTIKSATLGLEADQEQAQEQPF